MKFFLFSILISSILASAPFHHKIVFFGGETVIGRVDEFGEDTLRFQPQSEQDHIYIPLDSILYVHDGEGKLFYVSEKLKTFVEKGVGRGGMIVTTDGKEHPYYRLGGELFMYHPKLVYYSSDTSERKSIELERIHKIMIDHTLSEYAVKRGFLAGIGLTAFRFLIKFKSLKQLFNFSKLYNSTSEVYPGAVTLTPMITLGWVIYDYFKGERELIINPIKTP